MFKIFFNALVVLGIATGIATFTGSSLLFVTGSAYALLALACLSLAWKEFE